MTNFKYPFRTVEEKNKKAYWHVCSKLSLYNGRDRFIL